MPQTAEPHTDPVMLDQVALDQLFKESTCQGDVLLGIYHMIFTPEFFERVDHFPGYCKCNQATADWLMRRFIGFDRKHHPNVLAGGLWLNNGFSIETEIPLLDFQIIPAPYVLKES